MIRLLISVAFALAVATSADAMSPARLQEPDTMITQIRNVRPAHQPCDLPSQVRINGICMLRTTPPPGPPTRLPQVCGMERRCMR